ncbi:MAG TPA: porin family protein [Bacteroidia bacterium]
MKLKFIVTVLVCASAVFCQAQLNIGIRAGGNYSNVSGPSPSEYKYRPGFHGGAYIEYIFAKNFSFQTEAVYSLKGFRHKYSTTTVFPTNIVSEDINVLYDLSYVDVPLLLNITFGSMGTYIGLGPQISFLTGVKWDGDNSITTATKTPPSSSGSIVTLSGSGKDGWNPVDVGFVVGAGSKFDTGFEYCLRAGYGLTNAIDPSKSTIKDSYHNLVFTATLGFAFGKREAHGSGHMKRRR